jgi:hypothetical protein
MNFKLRGTVRYSFWTTRFQSGGVFLRGVKADEEEYFFFVLFLAFSGAHIHRSCGNSCGQHVENVWKSIRRRCALKGMLPPLKN